jgi:hydroxymethylpyrimidine/phosphomethylpyrimidine kinase
MQADLQVFRALGLHGAGVVTALTVQDSGRVHQVLPVFPNVVLEQIRALLADLTPDAVKIGMLASDDVARMVELGLRELLERSEARPPLVIDPVLAASDGTPLLERRALGILQDLVARSTVVTPNLAEAEALTGCDVSSDEGSESAATALVAHLGAEAALLTGGHRKGPPRDLLARRSGGSVTLTWLEGERVAGGAVHGTGCALSSAIAVGLARGRDIDVAVNDARAFVAAALRRATQRGRRARFLVYSD